MSINETVERHLQYLSLRKNAFEKTKHFFQNLCEVYNTQLFLLNNEFPESIVKPDINKLKSSYNFKINGNSYSLSLLDGAVMLKEPEEISEDYKNTEPVEAIVSDKNVSCYISGCIVLTMQIENQHATLLRVFVNSSNEIAYEYGMGWKRNLSFSEIPTKAEVINEFFVQPIHSSLMEIRETWAPFENIKLLDNLSSLNPNNNTIGFL
ncbi:hypothetical protein C162_20366 [Paenibacillus sp. FSL R7-269]|uniref:hypothetical protein n=1 Tax=Paenibacillus sp. FSL R7-269 TaxID=1226755 RepID=UPI0003E28D49|nr:hypothetical protein [Paenibacillus sp. FSL R7-269]ETT45725.1 hypothetical protein C162_20366 [Paenibacillus sp. FSL R7-269]